MVYESQQFARMDPNPQLSTHSFPPLASLLHSDKDTQDKTTLRSRSPHSERVRESETERVVAGVSRQKRCGPHHVEESGQCALVSAPSERGLGTLRAR